jgi:hypothetical protein
MEERVRRIAANEALARQVNERLEDLNEAFSAITDSFAIICECGDVGCIEQIHLSREDYSRLRSDPTHFAVIAGHEIPDTEHVVERRQAYDVVRKREGLPARLAEATDPN